MDSSTDTLDGFHAIDQLVVLSKGGDEFYIRLFPEITATQLQSKIDEIGLSQFDRIFLHADDKPSPKYIELLKEALPKFQSFGETDLQEAGVHRVRMRAMCTFTDDYWRAIAKIGFHYYLVNSRRGVNGAELGFADLRRFIIEGGNHEPFFSKPAVRFGLPFGKLPDGSAVLPSAWAHVLAADETCKAAVAMVSLFMGPRRPAPTYHINLGRFDSKLVVPGAHCAHVYLYDDNVGDGKHTGHVEAKTLTRLQ